MRLILVRHGKAVDRDAWHHHDSDRPLTEQGIDHASRVFKLVKPYVKAHEVWTSPYARARQTAEIASGIWKVPLREVDWLAPEAMPATGRIAELPRDVDVALVGHEPDLGLFAGALLAGNPVPLKKAGIAVLEGEPAAAGMQLRLVLTPKLVLGLADG
jgi:phosphohistidine phosphatase